MNTKYPKLLRPITLAGLTLKNRIFSAPTSLSELGPDTKYTREGIEYYKLRAAGGAAVASDIAIGASASADLLAIGREASAAVTLPPEAPRAEFFQAITQAGAPGWVRDLLMWALPR